MKKSVIGVLNLAEYTMGLEVILKTKMARHWELGIRISCMVTDQLICLLFGFGIM